MSKLLYLVQDCVGYNQMEVMLDGFVRPDQFDKIPKVCHVHNFDLTSYASLIFLFLSHNFFQVPRLLKFGKEVFLVSKKEGQVANVNIESIRQLNSCVRIDLLVQPGMSLVKVCLFVQQH